jgi:hypothetical protein
MKAGGRQMLWTGTPALEEQIVAYEKAHGVTFPADYRAFLSSANGGVPLRRTQPRRAASVIARLFELDAAREEANLWSAQVRFAARIPPPLMPIGESTSGNVLCIGLFGAVRGHILSLDLQQAATEIAPSFSDFLEMSDAEAGGDVPPRHLRLVD